MKPYLHHPDDSEDLFARARHNDPDTSHEAAALVQKITEAHKRIIALLDNYFGLTDEEIYEYLTKTLTISPSGCRTRRNELVGLGTVIDSGERRLTKSGRRTIVWKLRP